MDRMMSSKWLLLKNFYWIAMAARCDDEWMRWTNVLHDSEELHRIIALTGECCRRWWRRWQRVRWKNREIILNECMLRHESDISSQCARYFECFARFQHNTHIAFFRYHINNFISRCFFSLPAHSQMELRAMHFTHHIFFASFPNDTHSHYNSCLLLLLWSFTIFTRFHHFPDLIPVFVFIILDHLHVIRSSRFSAYKFWILRTRNLNGKK